MRHACTLSMPTLSQSDRAVDTRANRMKPQLAVSSPDKMNGHQFGGDCQVMMAERGEKSHENVVEEHLVVKRNSTSAIWTDSGFRRDDVLQTQVLSKTCQAVVAPSRGNTTSITTCNTTITPTPTIQRYPSLTAWLIICKIQYLFIYRSVIAHHRFSSYRAGLQ